jgi:hypothetical protein
MLFNTRVVTALVLAMALAGSPVVLEQCAASCDTHQASLETTPSCHHAKAASPHIGDTPARCGHDHNGTAIAATNARVDLSASNAVLPGIIALTHLASGVTTRLLPTDSPPGSAADLHARALPLRI